VIVKKQIISSIAAVGLALGSMLAGASVAAAEEAPSTGVCVPAPAVPATTEERLVTEAWVETIVHPAVTEEVEHDAVYETVEHPAETVDHPAETVDHPAVYETVVIVEAQPAVPEVPEVSHTDYVWKNWITQERQVTHDSNSPGFFWAKVGTEKHVTQEYVPGKPAVEEVTEQRLVKEAWSETVKEAYTETIKEAYTEEVLVTEAWTETVVIVEAHTEKIEHDAVYETIDHPAVEAIKCQDGVTVTASTRCLDGTAYVGVRVVNNTGGALTVKSGPTSDVAFAANEVAAGGNFYQSYNQRAATLDAGKVVVALKNAGGAWTSTARYTSLDCEVTPVTPESPAPSNAAPAPAPTVTQVSNPVVNEANPTETLSAQEGSTLASTGANTRLFGIGAGILILGGVVIMATRRFSSN
jgi:hypothetical protein